MYQSKTKLILEIFKGLPTITAITGPKRYRHHLEILPFMMIFLKTQGFSQEEIAKIIKQWRGGEYKSILQKVKHFHCSGAHGMINHLIEQPDISLSTEAIKQMLAKIDKAALLDKCRVNRDDSPSNVMWLVSDKCLAKCIYCYHGTDIPERLNSKNKKYLPKEIIVRRIHELHELGCLDVTFTGGDPFCRDDMIDILEELIPLKWPSLSVVTKCPLSKEQLKRIQKIGSIIWSLDSLDDSCLERITRIPLLATQMLSSIKEAIKLAIPVKINVTATLLNIKNIPLLVEELIKIGVSSVCVKNYILPKKTVTAEQLAIPQKHQTLLNNKISELKKAYVSEAEIVYERVTQEQHEQALQYAYLESLRRKKPVSFTCKSGYTQMTIGVDGVVLLCEQEPEPIFGTVATQSIQEVWETNYIESIFNDSKKRNMCADECRSCSYFDLCGYRTNCYSRCLTHKGALFGSPEPAQCSLRRIVSQKLSNEEERPRLCKQDTRN